MRPRRVHRARYDWHVPDDGQAHKAVCVTECLLGRRVSVWATHTDSLVTCEGCRFVMAEVARLTLEGRASEAAYVQRLPRAKPRRVHAVRFTAAPVSHIQPVQRPAAYARCTLRFRGAVWVVGGDKLVSCQACARLKAHQERLSLGAR